MRRNVEWASGGNSSFRRDLVSRAGGFEEGFEGNAIFEDTDFSYRVRRLGYDILFEPAAVVTHLAVNSGGCKTRSQTGVDYYYWFIRNKTLFFRRNFPFHYLPLLIAANLARATKTGLIERRNWQDFARLIRATRDGWSAAS
jgi:GT2 family glycosyltransferase